MRVQPGGRVFADRFAVPGIGTGGTAAEDEAAEEAAAAIGGITGDGAGL